jgi:hypothetical protein
LTNFLITALLIGNALAYGEETTPPVDVDTPTRDALNTDAPTATAEKINVVFNVMPRQKDHKLYFDIETNLPDGMVFMGAIRDEMGIVHKISSTMARVQTEIISGRITLGPFPLVDRPFPPGEYKLYINSYPDEYQPENVINIIGKRGANLAGQHVIGGLILLGKTFMITG